MTLDPADRDIGDTTDSAAKFGDGIKRPKALAATAAATSSPSSSSNTEAAVKLSLQERLRQQAQAAEEAKAAKKKAAKKKEKEEQEAENEQQAAASPFAWNQAYTSWTCSMFVHMVLLIALGLLVFHEIKPEFELIVSMTDPVIEEDLEELEKETPEIEPVVLKEAESEEEDEIVNAEDLNMITEVLDDEEAGEAVANVDDAPAISDLLASTDWMSQVAVPKSDRTGAGNSNNRTGGTGRGNGNAGAGRGAGLGGRASRRGQLPHTGLEEKAVEKGLMWLAKHQLRDGSWSYEHRAGGDCRGQCGNPGNLPNARFAATGMALLPFLGAGYTHQHGPYKRTVYGGLSYLLNSMTNDGGMCGPEGKMYGHGIATLALCEAAGMLQQMAPEHDYGPNNPDGSPKTPEQLKADLEKKKQQFQLRRLAAGAKKAARMVNAAQGPAGGWRYKPGELGDTSVVGWQVMALKAAKDAGLVFDPRVRARALGYLALVQSELAGDEAYGMVGTKYAYQPDKQSSSRATDAIGMLCRIYMGLSIHHPAVIKVAQQLAAEGHGSGDLYFNYYANQIMYQVGGAQWKQWSGGLNNFLKGSQAHGGHLEGSWHFAGGDHGSSSGGRLYCTAMALLCLEEHYRHLRIAEDAAANELAHEIPDAKANPANAGDNWKELGPDEQAEEAGDGGKPAGEAKAAAEEKKPPVDDFPLE